MKLRLLLPSTVYKYLLSLWTKQLKIILQFCTTPTPTLFYLFIYKQAELPTLCTINYLFLQLLLALGTKLQHVITQLAHEVAEKHVAVQGDLIVKPSDEHFWFGRPKFVLFLIHFILFQNAFEMAFFFWIWVG